MAGALLGTLLLLQLLGRDKGRPHAQGEGRPGTGQRRETEKQAWYLAQETGKGTEPQRHMQQSPVQTRRRQRGPPSQPFLCCEPTT